MKFVMFTDGKGWWRDPGEGYAKEISEAYRYTAEEIDHLPYPAGVILPCPEWHTQLRFRIYNEIDSEYAIDIPDDSGNVGWSDELAKTVYFSRDAGARHVANIHALYQSKYDYDEDDVKSIKLVPVPVELPRALGGGNTQVDIDTESKVSEFQDILDQLKAARQRKQGASADSVAVDEVYGEKVRWVDDDGTAWMVHSSDRCEPPCPIHAPSHHHMRDWNLTLGEGPAVSLIAFRHCDHGVIHPDPDDKAVRENPTEGAHRCDGCCVSD